MFSFAFVRVEDMARAMQLAAEHRHREAARIEARHIASVANASGSGGVVVMGGGGACMDTESREDAGF